MRARIIGQRDRIGVATVPDGGDERLECIMRTWIRIITAIVMVLTLEWEQKLGLLLGSHSMIDPTLIETQTA